MEEDESLMTQMLPEQFDVDQSTIVRQLKNLGKVGKEAGWVSHELSDAIYSGNDWNKMLSLKYSKDTDKNGR